MKTDAKLKNKHGRITGLAEAITIVTVCTPIILAPSSLV
jgi:hypothetical protein